VKPGRNDPCPCGSGKKYKKCCLLKEQTTRSEAGEAPPDMQDSPDSLAVATARMSNALDNMRRRHLDNKPHMEEYYRARKLHGEIIGAMIQYHDDGKFEQKIDPNFAIEYEFESPPHLQLLESAFDLNTDIGVQAFFDLAIYKISPNMSCITEDFIQKHRYRKPEKLDFLQSMLDSKLGLFEVTGIDSGDGYAYLKEVFTGAEYAITDVGLSCNRNYDNIYIYTRIINFRDISFSTGLNFVFRKTDRFIKKHIQQYKKNYKPLGELLRFTQLYNRYSKNSGNINVIPNVL
jgi:hypothetical protein